MLENLGHYKILDRIGADAIGDVYRARDTKLGRTVAVKVLSPEISKNPGRRNRLLLDARAAIALSHPNIAMLYEVGEDKDLTYLVCEFVPGEPLTTIISNRSLNPRRAIDFATQLADALADAHAEGIVHRNLRSSTVTVTPKDKVKILDFGLAPWQKRGAAAIPVASADEDFSADVFALGGIFFEMLTGKQPPPATLPAPSTINPAVPRELDQIALKALSKGADNRYQSAATLAAELRSVAAILDVRSGDREPPTLAPVRPRPARVGLWITAALILATIVGLVWFATRTG
jgi:serine/threonine-protein kinase